MATLWTLHSRAASLPSWAVTLVVRLERNIQIDYFNSKHFIWESQEKHIIFPPPVVKHRNGIFRGRLRPLVPLLLLLCRWRDSRIIVSVQIILVVPVEVVGREGDAGRERELVPPVVACKKESTGFIFLNIWEIQS